MRVLKAVCCATALAAFLAPASARADEWNKKTILTFSGPVQIPGATLAEGTYVFKLADLMGNRHVVQVFDKDEKKIYGTILAIPDKRLEPADKPVVLFAERPAGTPQAIRAWFYPGDTFGNEFVYPKSQAMRIAKETHQSVLAMDEDTASTTDEQRMSAMKGASVSRVDENGQSSAVNTEEQNAQAAGTSGSTPATTSGSTGTAAQSNTATSGSQTTTASNASKSATTTSGAASTTASSDARLKNGSGEAARTRSNTASNTANSNRATATSGRNAGHANTTVGTSGQSSDTSNNTANNSRRGRKNLPRTASSLALFELLSGLSIVGAVGVRRVRARLAESR